ncbi:hypothetical protein HNR76_001312 [Pseudoxanthomonas broegbernensis]|nr:hypothetical protein [Pseudoxanthomonas broegbernensis]
MRHQAAGASAIAAKANTNPYRIKPTASQEMNFTPRRPKNSLMVSVMMNTTGHSRVPAVKLSEPVWPNRFHSSGRSPRVSSRAKILTPMNSASAALTQKNAASAMNSRTARSSSVRAAGAVTCARPRG